MKARSRSAKSLIPFFVLSPFDRICLSCRRSILANRRPYASAAAALAEAPSYHPSPSIDINSISSPRPTYRLHAGVVLSRPPQITRDLHPFEKAFFLYQRRLNERLALPFTRYFYFKKGTPADAEWKRKAKERLTPARDIGIYDAYGKEQWNDEVLVGARESEPEWQVEMLVRDAEGSGVGEAAAGVAVDKGEEVDMDEGHENKRDVGMVGGVEQVIKREEVERPLRRVTEADRLGDLKSLDRLLHRTLYLLVKGVGGRWEFPNGRLSGKETLHQAAERIMVQAGGVSMNTWVVGNAPVGHYVYDYHIATRNEEKRSVELGEKVFFMKSRIMGGQFNIAENKFGLEEFKWLAKEEIRKLVTTKYWSMTQDMLAER